MPKYILLTREISYLIGENHLKEELGIPKGDIRDSEVHANAQYAPYICNVCKHEFYTYSNDCPDCGASEIQQQRFCIHCEQVYLCSFGSPQSRDAVLPCPGCGERGTIAIGHRVYTCSTHKFTYPVTRFYAVHQITPECRLLAHVFKPRKYKLVKHA